MKPPSPKQSKPLIVGLLLAAGFGKRFDPTVARDKLLVNLPDGKPVLWHSASALISKLPSCVAVVQANQTQRAELLRGLGYEVCVAPAASKGMGYSLASGIAHLLSKYPEVSGVVIALADMPWLPRLAIAAVADALEGLDDSLPPQMNENSTVADKPFRQYVAPSFGGNKGHPVGFNRPWFEQLTGLQGDRGASSLLANAKWIDLPWQDEAVLRDIDTPADLSQMRLSQTRT